MKIFSRKDEHIRICINKPVESGNTEFDKFRIKHMALPEIDFDEISTEIKFLGRKLAHPIIIGAMTGGTEKTEEINKDLAEIAQDLKIGFGVGSQRVFFDRKNLSMKYNLREIAPDVLLIANLGAVQLNYGFGIEECKKAIEMIDADALALHLNPLQEVIQPEGNKNFSNLVEKINKISENLEKPVIVKETGCGISYEIAKKLKVAAIDVSGAGGTSWSLIESYRTDKRNREIGRLFSTWGIPTALAIKEVSKLPVYVIGSGGIRNGLEAAKALALGASCVSIALPILREWSRNGKPAVREFLEKFILELKIAMFLSGSKKLSDLKGKIYQID
ncbi:MAG: type 2 isopentenyl-diphosphate Delta-isomerase [Candidatus Altiarchaeota archaeon]